MTGTVYFIEDNCTRCEACVPICPVQCIFFGIDQFVIDSDLCIGCGLCKSVCDDQAIESRPDQDVELPV